MALRFQEAVAGVARLYSIWQAISLWQLAAAVVAVVVASLKPLADFLEAGAVTAVVKDTLELAVGAALTVAVAGGGFSITEWVALVYFLVGLGVEWLT
jgi:hypothetical protein